MEDSDTTDYSQDEAAESARRRLVKKATTQSSTWNIAEEEANAYEMREDDEDDEDSRSPITTPQHRSLHRLASARPATERRKPMLALRKMSSLAGELGAVPADLLHRRKVLMKTLKQVQSGSLSSPVNPMKTWTSMPSTVDNENPQAARKSSNSSTESETRETRVLSLHRSRSNSTARDVYPHAPPPSPLVLQQQIQQQQQILNDLKRQHSSKRRRGPPQSPTWRRATMHPSRPRHQYLELPTEGYVWPEPGQTFSQRRTSVRHTPDDAFFRPSMNRQYSMLLTTSSEAPSMEHISVFRSRSANPSYPGVRRDLVPLELTAPTASAVRTSNERLAVRSSNERLANRGSNERLAARGSSERLANRGSNERLARPGSAANNFF
jgi:hypothetical protein